MFHKSGHFIGKITYLAAQGDAVEILDRELDPTTARKAETRQAILDGAYRLFEGSNSNAEAEGEININTFHQRAFGEISRANRDELDRKAISPQIQSSGDLSRELSRLTEENRQNDQFFIGIAIGTPGVDYFSKQGFDQKILAYIQTSRDIFALGNTQTSSPSADKISEEPQPMSDVFNKNIFGA